MISNIKKLIFQGLIINNTNNYNKLSLKTIYLQTLDWESNY